MNTARRLRLDSFQLLRAGLATGRGSPISGTGRAVHSVDFLDRGSELDGQADFYSQKNRVPPGYLARKFNSWVLAAERAEEKPG